MKDNKFNATSLENLRSIEIQNSLEEIETKEKFNELQQKNEDHRRLIDLEESTLMTTISLAEQMKETYKAELETTRKTIDEMHTERTEKEQAWLTVKKDLEQKHEEEQEKAERNLSEVLERLTTLHEQQARSREQETRLREIEKTITTKQYSNIDKDVMNHFIVPKFDKLVNYVKNSVQDVDEVFFDRLPKISFEKVETSFTFTIIGFPKHHDSFKKALQQIKNLSEASKSVERSYQKILNDDRASMVRTLQNVPENSTIWKQYVRIFIQLLNDKIKEYVIRFNGNNRAKSSSLIEQSIMGLSDSPQTELKITMNQFIERYPFINGIEGLQHKALEEFIEQNIQFQRIKFEKTPSKMSLDTIKFFIDRIKTKLKTDSISEGHQLQYFEIIPKLLQQAMIYYSCFKEQLPLFDLSRELLDKIENNTVTTITTSTGSGKRFRSHMFKI